jgi:hypothetical protein
MFGSSGQTSDKYKPWCKDCNKLYMKQYRDSHPELREKERNYAKNLYLSQKYISSQNDMIETPNIIPVNNL